MGHEISVATRGGCRRSCSLPLWGSGMERGGYFEAFPVGDRVLLFFSMLADGWSAAGNRLM